MPGKRATGYRQKLFIRTLLYRDRVDPDAWKYDRMLRQRRIGFLLGGAAPFIFLMIQLSIELTSEEGSLDAAGLYACGILGLTAFIALGYWTNAITGKSVVVAILGGDQPPDSGQKSDKAFDEKARKRICDRLMRGTYCLYVHRKFINTGDCRGLAQVIIRGAKSEIVSSAIFAAYIVYGLAESRMNREPDDGTGAGATGMGLLGSWLFIGVFGFLLAVALHGAWRWIRGRRILVELDVLEGGEAPGVD